MDPQAAWNEMLDAIAARDREQTLELAEGLLEWMKKGGVPPQTSAVSLPRQWNRATAEFGCLLALQLAKKPRSKPRKDSNA
jgi:hypothetical protein